MGLVIEKTQVVYLKSFPCVIVKKTFQVTCSVASFQIQKMNLILFRRVPGVPTDLDPPTELSENIILNVLVEIDNTLRFSAY